MQFFCPIAVQVMEEFHLSCSCILGILDKLLIHKKWRKLKLLYQSLSTSNQATSSISNITTLNDDYKGALATTTATAVKTSLLKKTLLFSNFPAVFQAQMWVNFPGINSWGPHPRLERERETCRLMLTSSIKRR